MAILDQLGVALGLATLSGVDLYLTVLITGLAIRFDWVHLADRFHSLEALGHPAVLTVAGILYLLEFLADKIPWVDTLWDSVHTVIRPLGGTLVALQSLGDVPAPFKVAAALLASWAALTTHGAKAGARLFINHSPEPLSNIGMSLAEDAAVVGGMALTLIYPAIALAVFSATLIVLWLIFPRMWRMIRATLWLAWRKLRMPGARSTLELPVDLSKETGHDLKHLLADKSLKLKDVKWSVRCLSGKCKGLPGLVPNLQGLLIANNQTQHLFFATTKGLRKRLYEIPLSGAAFSVDSRVLSENLLLEAKGLKAIFRFPRGQADIAETIVLRLTEITNSENAPADKAAGDVKQESGSKTRGDTPFPRGSAASPAS